MKLLSLYIIHEDGRCLYDANFVPNPPPSQLVTGLLTAMQNFVQEMTGSYVNHFSAAGYTFVSEPIGPISIVMALADEFLLSENLPLTELGINFLKYFGDKLEDWTGDMSDFSSFDDILAEILKIEKVKERIEPKNPLNALTLMSLPENLQEVARYVLEKREASPHEFAKSKNFSENEAIEKFEELLSMGHIGRLVKDDTPVYFVL